MHFIKNAKILKIEMNERAPRYSHFELKNITFDEKNPMVGFKTALHLFTAYGNTRSCDAYSRAALINFSAPCAALNRGRRLFE